MTLDLDATKWRRLEELFNTAVELPGEQRDAFVQEACGDDPDLKRHLEQLLQADSEETDAPLLDTPALGAGFHVPPAEELSPRLAAPERIGPYRVERHLATGGMGEVYLGRRCDGAYDQLVAIKLINVPAPSPTALERFRRERQTLAHLNHPNIAQLLDGGATQDGRPYIVMEYVQGRRLDEYCLEKSMTLRQRLRLFVTVCRAVQFAHQHLIVHRDLKPGNVLVTDEGVVKLLDFGIAKALDPAEEQQAAATQTRPLLTPDYASPEQVRQERITTATDVYSLGVMLYELVTGRRPYRVRTKSPAETERSICETIPVRPSLTEHAASDAEPAPAVRAASAWRRQLRGDLDNIILTALRKEPQRRYQTAEQLADDIENHMHDRAVTARPDTPGYLLAKFVRRNRAAVLAVASVILVLAGAAILSGVLARQAQEERRLAQLAEAQAAQEAAHARDVTAFLTDLFRSADPYQPQGADLTARDLVERGAGRLESQLQDQPLRRAVLLAALGEVQINLGEYQMALASLERAEGLTRDDENVPLSERAELLRNLGLALAHLGRHEESLARYGRALALRERLDSEPTEIADILDDMAGVHAQMGQFERADALYAQALQRYGAAQPPDELRIAAVHSGLASLNWGRGDYEGAEEHVRRALALRRAHLAADDPELAGTTQDLGAILHMQGKLDEAEMYYLEGERIMAEALGASHPALLEPRSNLAALAMDRGDADTAASRYEKVLQQARATYGDEHPKVADALTYLGVIEDARDNVEESVEYLKEAAAMHGELLPPDHPHLATTLSLLGDILAQAAGRPDEAEPYLRESLRIRRQALGDDHWQTAVSRSMLGDCHRLAGRYDEAEPLLRESLTIIAGAFGEGHEQTELALQRLIRFCEAIGRADEATALQERLGHDVVAPPQ